MAAASTTWSSTSWRRRGLPEDLTWFKWEAYATWLSGFLLVIVYYLGAELFLIDSSVLELPAWAGGAISVASLALGWIVYDRLCKSPLGDNDTGCSPALFVFLVLAGLGLHGSVQRAAAPYMQIGALIGTIMAANVAMVIIPNQKKVVADLIAGRTPDPAWARRPSSARCTTTT